MAFSLRKRDSIGDINERIKQSETTIRAMTRANAESDARAGFSRRYASIYSLSKVNQSFAY
ncbi:hypothetical protein [Rhizobium tubonense]|uniref:hypothetical protein n=1 Tax=Rhizobium tubonense TaxID=484088 RepID=UPI0011B684A1|nr:hypothetical protein [Rhizobium tubonense]